MLERFYYSISETASLLGVDVETILQNAEKSKIILSLKHNEILIDTSDDQNMPYITSIDNCYHLSADTIMMIRHFASAGLGFPYTTNMVNLLGSKNKLFSLVEPGENYPISLSDHVVCTHIEITRLKALKAQQDGKPTLEQVQAENEALKQQLEQLKNSTKGKQQQRELILSGWVAGKGIEAVRRLTQADIHEELKRVNRLFQIAESTFEDFWQVQKLVKLDAGKR